MRKIVIVPEHFDADWDGENISYNIKKVFSSYLKNLETEKDFICEYYFRNLLNKKDSKIDKKEMEIQKAICNSKGEISVVETGKTDIISVFSDLQQEDIKNSFFFIDVWCDESSHGTIMQSLADIISASTVNFAFFNEFGGHELSDSSCSGKGLKSRLYEKYKGLPAERYLEMLTENCPNYLKRNLDKGVFKIGDNTSSNKINPTLEK